MFDIIVVQLVMQILNAEVRFNPGSLRSLHVQIGFNEIVKDQIKLELFEVLYIYIVSAKYCSRMFSQYWPF